MKVVKTIAVMLTILVTVAFSLKPAEGYEVGDIATDFSLENVNGEQVSLANYEKAKGFIVVFTCNTCPYSVAYEDRIIALDKKYKGKGYPVIAINPNDPAVSKGDGIEAMKTRADEKGFTFPYLLDKGQKVYPQYGATRTPHVFILTKEKALLKVAYIGAIDNNSRNASAVTKRYVEDAVDALLLGETPEKTTSRAIGCSIKTAG